jgi:hypothetical protein
VITLFNPTPTFEWHLTKFVAKNNTRKDMWYDEVDVRAQIKDTIMELNS